MPQKGTTPLLPEIRLLSDSEIEVLRGAQKVIIDDIAFQDVSPPSWTGRKWRARVDVYLSRKTKLPFDVQSTMELTLVVNRGGEQDFYYRVVMTRQILRMYHKSPGHLEGGIVIKGPHKHRFTLNLKRGGYTPDVPIPEKLRAAVAAFLEEENIEFRGQYKPPQVPTTIDSF